MVSLSSEKCFEMFSQLGVNFHLHLALDEL